MSKLKVRVGKGKLVLKKSSQLVGLKGNEKKELDQEKFVKKAFFKNLGGFNVVTLSNDGNTVDEQLDEVRTRSDIDVGTHVYFTEGSDKPLVPTGEIFITFVEGTSEEEQAIVLDEYKLELVERKSEDEIVVKVTPRSPNPLKVASFLEDISMVRFAEPDIDTTLEEYDFSTPRDALINHQWHLKNEGFVSDANFRLTKGADSKVVDAWQRLGSMGSNKVVVAVVDNGFDLSHPDLRDKVYKPYDLWNNSTRVSQGDPRFTHGTPCASVAIAASNGQGIVGSSPNARFMPVSGTSFSNRVTEQMFDYCVKNGADIISCSWGTTDPNFSLSSIKEATISKAAREGRNGKGCIILFAVGNDGHNFVNFYAAHPDVIGVAASDSNDRHASYSNRGREVSVCAPSNGHWPIIAARAWWDEGVAGETGNYKYWRDGKSRGKHYKHFGGTSSATPLVAGICALMLTANPDLTAREVKQILEQTADKIGSSSDYYNGHSQKYGYGRVNADRAVAEARRRRQRNDPPPPVVKETVSAGKGLYRFNVKRQSPSGYGVQIGAFGDYGNVLIQAEKLQRQFGQETVVSIQEVNGGTVFKLIVGAFSNKNDAKNLAKRMKDNGVNGFVRGLSEL